MEMWWMFTSLKNRLLVKKKEYQKWTISLIKKIIFYNFLMGNNCINK